MRASPPILFSRKISRGIQHQVIQIEAQAQLAPAVRLIPPQEVQFLVWRGGGVS